MLQAGDRHELRAAVEPRAERLRIVLVVGAGLVVEGIVEDDAGHLVLHRGDPLGRYAVVDRRAHHVVAAPDGRHRLAVELLAGRVETLAGEGQRGVALGPDGLGDNL